MEDDSDDVDDEAGEDTALLTGEDVRTEEELPSTLLEDTTPPPLLLLPLLALLLPLLPLLPLLLPPLDEVDEEVAGCEVGDEDRAGEDEEDEA